MCACDKEEEKYKREVRVGEERSNESGGQTERRDREGESWRRIDNTAPILRAASPMQALSTFKMHYVDVLKPKESRCTHEFSEGRINCPTGWIFVELGLDRRGRSVSTLVLFLEPFFRWDRVSCFSFSLTSDHRMHRMDANLQGKSNARVMIRVIQSLGVHSLM